MNFSYWTNQVNFDALLEAGAHLANMIIGNFNFLSTLTVEDKTKPNVTSNTVTNPTGSGLGDLAQALADIPGQSHAAATVAQDYLEDIAFDGVLMLKANTPKVIFYGSFYRTELRAYGPSFKDIRVEQRSFFRTTHVIEPHAYAYDYDGNLLGQDWDCCNELYGWWHHTNVSLPDFADWNLSSAMLRNEIIKDLNYGGMRDWSYASLIPGTMNDYTADVDLSNMTHGIYPITAINWNQGEMGSTGECGCENLYEFGNPLSGRLLSPTLFSQDDCIWANGGGVVIQDVSYPQSLVTAGLITTYWMFGSSKLNQPNQPLGLPDIGHVLVTDPGVYALVYEDANNPTCRTVSYFNLPQCVGKTGYTEQTQISITPNPANQSIWIGVGNQIQNNEIVIVDQSGKEVYHELVEGKVIEISVQNWPNGVYFLTNLSNENVSHAKFIVAH